MRITTAIYLLTDGQCRRLLTAYGYPADPAYHCDGLRGIVGMLVATGSIVEADIHSLLTTGRISTMTFGFTYEIENDDGDLLDVTGDYERGTPNQPTREDPGYGEPMKIYITEILSRETGQAVEVTNEIEDWLLPILEDKIQRDDPEA